MMPVPFKDRGFALAVVVISSLAVHFVQAAVWYQEDIPEYARKEIEGSFSPSVPMSYEQKKAKKETLTFCVLANQKLWFHNVFFKGYEKLKTASVDYEGRKCSDNPGLFQNFISTAAKHFTDLDVQEEYKHYAMIGKKMIAFKDAYGPAANTSVADLEKGPSDEILNRELHTSQFCILASTALSKHDIFFLERQIFMKKIKRTYKQCKDGILNVEILLKHAVKHYAETSYPESSRIYKTLRNNSKLLLTIFEDFQPLLDELKSGNLKPFYKPGIDFSVMTRDEKIANFFKKEICKSVVKFIWQHNVYFEYWTRLKVDAIDFDGNKCMKNISESIENIELATKNYADQKDKKIQHRPKLMEDYIAVHKPVIEEIAKLKLIKIDNETLEQLKKNLTARFHIYDFCTSVEKLVNVEKKACLEKPEESYKELQDNLAKLLEDKKGFKNRNKDLYVKSVMLFLKISDIDGLSVSTNTFMKKVNVTELCWKSDDVFRTYKRNYKKVDGKKVKFDFKKCLSSYDDVKGNLLEAASKYALYEKSNKYEDKVQEIYEMLQDYAPIFPSDIEDELKTIEKKMKTASHCTAMKALQQDSKRLLGRVPRKFYEECIQDVSSTEDRLEKFFNTFKGKGESEYKNVNMTLELVKNLGKIVDIEESKIENLEKEFKEYKAESHKKSFCLKANTIIGIFNERKSRLHEVEDLDHSRDLCMREPFKTRAMLFKTIKVYVNSNDQEFFLDVKTSFDLIEKFKYIFEISEPKEYPTIATTEEATLDFKMANICNYGHNIIKERKTFFDKFKSVKVKVLWFSYSKCLKDVHGMKNNLRKVVEDYISVSQYKHVPVAQQLLSVLDEANSFLTKIKTCPKLMNESVIREIMEVHNGYRSNISAKAYVVKGKTFPPASKSIPKLKWNDTLAMFAQTRAEECRKTAPNPVSKVISKVPVLGQTFYYKVHDTCSKCGSEFNLNSILGEWVKEVEGFTQDGVCKALGTVPMAEREGIRGFLQMINSQTTSIGCGVTQCGCDMVFTCFYGNKPVVDNQPIYEHEACG